MSEPFLGQISMFGGNFAPAGWTFCNGQLLAIAQNQALFSILGTIYGGDGETTFGLPDLRGRAPIHWGSGAGLSTRSIGAKGGAETVTLTTSQIPSHDHTLLADAGSANASTPLGNAHAIGEDPNRNALNQYSNVAPTSAMHADTVGSTGGGQSHENMMPWQAVSYIIALTGVFPSPN